MTGPDRTLVAVAAVLGLAALVAVVVGVPAPALGPPVPLDLTAAPPPPERPGSRPIPKAPRPIPEGVRSQTLPSGVTVTELQNGTGAEPLEPGRVAVLEYTAWRDDGQVAGSSYRRATPTRLPLPAAESEIAGWQLGLLGLRAGGVRRIVQPASAPEEGGAQPRPELLYEVELVSVLVPPDRPVAVADDAWTALPGGIASVDLVVGEGDEIVAGRQATFDYAVFLPDGTKLDDSWTRSAAVRLPIGSGKLAFEPGLIGARVGGRRQLRVPAALAPSSKARPSSVPEGTPLLVIIEPRAVE